MKLKKFAIGGIIALVIFGIIILFGQTRHSNKSIEVRTQVMNDKVNIPVEEDNAAPQTSVEPTNTPASSEPKPTPETAPANQAAPEPSPAPEPQPDPGAETKPVSTGHVSPGGGVVTSLSP